MPRFIPTKSSKSQEVSKTKGASDALRIDKNEITKILEAIGRAHV